MTTIAELVEFQRELFFDGAVQIGWLGSDHEKRDKAASNFVFHGPRYHGVGVDDYTDSKEYSLTDTVSFTEKILDSLIGDTRQENSISLAIAGYGTGKSHLALTLSTLLENPNSETSRKILSNIEQADPLAGKRISIKLSEPSSPFMVIPINGMGNFDLAAELSKQVVKNLKSLNLDTSPIEDLWPRFQLAQTFVERNFDIRADIFHERFGEVIHESEITDLLLGHDEKTFQLVNEIFEKANGYPLRAIGEESPTQLIEVLCESYCGEGKPFQAILIIFDEFGRYLEFAANRPHIAGDSALQQIYEGVQNNSDKCSLLCLNQYELKAYLSRISRDSQSTIQRYITRYDSARKHYLSSNLETLFANLIHKKDDTFLNDFLLPKSKEIEELLNNLHRWFPASNGYSVWRDPGMFQQVIVEGCWPLHPLATWFLSRSSEFLQQRSAITFVADAIERENHREIQPEENWSISATALCESTFIKELIAAEEYGQGGAVAQSFEAVTQKYQHDLSPEHNQVLVAILIAAKLGMKVSSNIEARAAISSLSSFAIERVDHAISDLEKEFGVIEWNDRFLRYDILGDSVPRSAFLSFLRKRKQGVSKEDVEQLFSAHCKTWANLKDIDPQFANFHDISTPEWTFFTRCTHLAALERNIENAIYDWKESVKPDSSRGQLIYCFIDQNSELDQAKTFAYSALKKELGLRKVKNVPIVIVLLYDEEGKISNNLTEYSIINSQLSVEEKQKFSHFIEDYKEKLLEELQDTCAQLTTKRWYCSSDHFDLGKKRLQIECNNIFSQAYPEIIPFPFDGFGTSKGNAAKDCRTITSELFSGSLNHEWIATQRPETQNRATRLLKTWGAMGDDGLVRLHPRHQKFGVLITEIEERLEEEKVLNLGKLFNNLISTPYGFNLASAGLTLGVFLAPRSDVSVLVFEDQDITPRAWVSKALSGNFINLKILEKTSLRYVSDSEAGEWQKLMSKWDLEPTHIGKVSYWDQSRQLRERVPLPPGELFERYKRLEEHSVKAIKLLKDLEKFIDNEYLFLEKSYKSKNTGNLSRICKDVKYRIKRMDGEIDFWVEENFTELRKLYGQSKEAVIQFFDDWLSKQSCLDARRAPDFRRYMIDQICVNLRSIELVDLADKTEKHALNIISQIDERQKVLYIVNEAKAYLASRYNRVNQQVRVTELRNWRKGAQDLVGPLTEARKRIDAPEVDTILKSIKDFQESCKAQIKIHEGRFSELWNLSINTLDDIKSGQLEVDSLLTIFFEDNPANIEDLHAMKQQLFQFEKDYLSFSATLCSNDELAQLINNKAEDTSNENDEEDEPPWDNEEVYGAILEDLLEKRTEIANNWISNNLLDLKEIPGMDARGCQLNLGKIESPPNCLSPEEENKVEAARQTLTRRLGELRLDGLLEMYRSLSPKQQKEFIEIAKNEIIESVA